MIGREILFELCGKTASSLVLFTSSIILTRLLLPEDFGIVASIMIIISIAETLVEVGLGSAIIQRNKISDLELSSTFYINIFVGTLAFLILFLCSNLIGEFYNNIHVTAATRWLSAIILIASFSTVQNAIMTKKMNFGRLAVINTFSALIGAITGVILAYIGYGFWSLVFQQLTYYSIRACSLWFSTRWIPKFIFRLNSLKPLWKYSSSIFLAQVLNMSFARLDGILIAKFFQVNMLGYYNRSRTLNDLVVQYTSGVLGKVMFPFLSKQQNDTHRFEEEFYSAYRVLSLVSILISSFVFLLSNELVVVLFTERWAASGRYLQLLSLSLFFHNVNFLFATIYKAKGEGSLFLKLEILKKTSLLICLFFGLKYGMEGIIWAIVVSKVCSTIINLIALKLKSIIRIPDLIIIPVKDLLFSLLPVISVLILMNYYSQLILVITSICSFSAIIFAQHFYLPRKAINIVLNNLSRNKQ